MNFNISSCSMLVRISPSWRIGNDLLYKAAMRVMYHTRARARPSTQVASNLGQRIVFAARTEPYENVVDGVARCGIRSARTFYIEIRFCARFGLDFWLLYFEPLRKLIPLIVSIHSEFYLALFCQMHNLAKYLCNDGSRSPMSRAGSDPLLRKRCRYIPDRQPITLAFVGSGETYNLRSISAEKVLLEDPT